MSRAGDADRERAVARLREHFAGGRITLEELDDRVGLVLRARSLAQLRAALDELPEFPVRELVRTAARGAALVLLSGAWLLFSFVLLVVLGLTLLIHGASLTLLGGALVVWLVPTYCLSRLWHRKLPRRTSSA